MELDLVKIVNKKTKGVTYHAVNDKHYNAMLAGAGSNLDDLYDWQYVGSVEIEDEILEEEGFIRNDPYSPERD